MADDGGASTTSEPATSETPPARWRWASGVVAGGLAASVAVHLALVGTVLVMGSWGRPPAPVKAVPVDVVTPDELAEMTEKAKTEPPPPPSLADTPGQQQQTPQAQPQQQQTPQPQSTTPPPAQPASPPPPPKLDAFAPPFPSSAAPSPDAPPPAPPPPTKSTGQADQLAQLLGLPRPVAGLSGGAPSDFKANLTSDEIAAFTAHVQGCWTALPAAAKAANLTVFIRVRLRRDGSLAGNPEPLGGSASMQALALLQNALTTLKSCPAYTALPADKYEEWRVLDLHFTPSGLSTASRVPSRQR